ncbi:hypothetical protein QX776_08130 [Alteromonadaceae bacterium BrNp21-10]|nr:hypothetical protein [Alteromonadaceae bacterium BrNp21-10]
MKLRLFLFALVTFPLIIMAGELYKVIDADGNPLYTDQPLPNAVPVDVSTSNANLIPSIATKSVNTTKAPPSANLYTLTIVSPAHEQTVRNNSGNVSITANLNSPSNQPKLNALVQLFLDGKLVQQQHSLQFTLENLDRGEHRISLKLIGNSGKVIALSPESVFYLHRASVLTKAN